MTYLWLFAVALIPQLIGHTSYNWALQWFSPSLIAVTLLGEPMLSTLWAYLFLNESVAPATFYGGALILVGVFFAVQGEQRTATTPHPVLE
jgi:drug/metabolite transporter (DMT)-like permease